MGVYGEFGRHPLYINRYVRIIKFWCKIVSSTNILLNRLYDIFVNAMLSKITGHIKRVERNERYCIFCQNRDIEDEYHFVISCPLYEDFRKQYIKAYFYRRPNVMKFTELFKSDNQPIIRNLSKFVYNAFILRMSLLC
jgi:hypothetical protein